MMEPPRRADGGELTVRSPGSGCVWIAPRRPAVPGAVTCLPGVVFIFEIIFYLYISFRIILGL